MLITYLRNSEYAKIKKLIENNENYISNLKEIIDKSSCWDDKRRAFVVLKKLNLDIVERYFLYEVISNIDEKKSISKICIEMIKKIGGREDLFESLLEISKRELDEDTICHILKNMEEDNIWYEMIKIHTNTKDIGRAIKNLAEKHNTSKILNVLLEKLKSKDWKERYLALKCLYALVDYLNDDDREKLRKSLNIELLGDKKKVQKNAMRLFKKLGVKIEFNEEELKKELITSKDKKRVLNYIMSNNIKLSNNFFNKEFFKHFLYMGDEELQFIGVKLISLKNDSKTKVDYLIRFLNAKGKAKSAAVRELRKFSNSEYKNYIKEKLLKSLSTKDLSKKTSVINLLKDFGDSSIFDRLLEEYRKLEVLFMELDEKWYLGGYHYMLMIENEMRKCLTAMEAIEKTIGSIAIRENLHYDDLKINKKLGKHLYKTIEVMGSSDTNSIDFDELLDIVKKNEYVVKYLSNIINANNNIGLNLRDKILKTVENIKTENAMYYKIRIYADLYVFEKFFEILDCLDKYPNRYIHFAFLYAVNKFIEKDNPLKNHILTLSLPKIILMVNDYGLRREALKFLKKYPSELALPVLINNLGGRDSGEIIEVIREICVKYPQNLSKIKDLLYQKENVKYAIEIIKLIGKENKDLVEDFIFILIDVYNNSSSEIKHKIKNTLTVIVKDEYKEIIDKFFNAN
ncbi:hypothetical protein [Methanotorris formicicus]|uniref:HEAT domain containing protein n=1 Tax=Methanotorris formicicus Mc-S-70 TaxID=647171 RepID=H1KWZ1_9EURY|nr:hypothetical protein [Methanotorris formicicus]EHP88817.1 HEAT domain containing protein [Methanotorris formicicus Mc-S-70]